MKPLSLRANPPLPARDGQGSHEIGASFYLAAQLS